jgi:Ca2+-binding EF-hand superfamily protein
MDGLYVPVGAALLAPACHRARRSLRNSTASIVFAPPKPEEDHTMELKSSSRLFFALPFAALAACNNAPSGEDLEVGEASAALSSDPSAADEADTAMGQDAVGDAAAESPDMTVDPADADSYAPCDFAARRAAVLAQYDVNQDGKLEASERAALRADIGERIESRPGGRLIAAIHRLHLHAFLRLKWAFDENNDGVLSPDERTALVDAMEARCEARRAKVLAKWDTDGDGKLSEQELAAARAAWRAQLKAKYDAILAQYDTNKNGVLDPTEREQLRADVIAKIQAKIAAIKAQFDTNGDGKLDATEIAALKAAIRAKIEMAPTDSDPTS